MQNKENYTKQTSSLAEIIKNKLKTSVAIGASRPAVEQGFIDRAHQVGQTGTSVSSNTYLAIGISGAIQHIVGINNVSNIIAINHDPKAPIFSSSDYYYIGDLNKVIPELISELTKITLSNEDH